MKFCSIAVVIAFALIISCSVVFANVNFLTSYATHYTDSTVSFIISGNNSNYIYIAGGNEAGIHSSGFYTVVTLDNFGHVASLNRTNISFSLQGLSLSNDVLVAVGVNGTINKLNFPIMANGKLGAPTIVASPTTLPQSLVNVTNYESVVVSNVPESTCVYITSVFDNVQILTSYENFAGQLNQTSNIIDSTFAPCNASTSLLVSADSVDDVLIASCGDMSFIPTLFVKILALACDITSSSASLSDAMKPTALFSYYDQNNNIHSIYVAGLMANGTNILNIFSSLTAPALSQASNLGPNSITNIQVSPNGSFVYMSTSTGAIRAYSRDSNTGFLTFLRSVAAPGLTSIISLAPDPNDAVLLYALSSSPYTIYTFGFNNFTQPPVLVSPLSLAFCSTTLNVTVILYESATTASLVFTPINGSTNYTIHLAGNAVPSSGDPPFNIQLSLNTLAIASSVPASYINTGTSASTIPPGNYTVTFSYQGAAGNPVAATSNGLYIIRAAPNPQLFSPTQSITYSLLLNVSYLIPIAPSTNQAQLIFSNGSTSITFTLSESYYGSQVNFILHTHNVSSAALSLIPQIKSISPSVSVIPDGLWTITLSYVDTYNNPAVQYVLSNVGIKTATTTPVIISPASGSVVHNTLLLSLNVPDTPYANSISLIFSSTTATTTATLVSFSGIRNFSVPLSVNLLNLSNYVSAVSGTSNNVTAGTYNITLSYNDALNNPTASTTATNVMIEVSSAMGRQLSFNVIILVFCFALFSLFIVDL